MNARIAPVQVSFLLAIAGCIALSGSWRLQAATAPEPFRDGDQWAVLGDSITHYGSYHQWINLFYLTRFPGREIDIFNCGISGDTAGGGLQRLEWDVLVHRPTVVTIMFGMNDVGRDLFRTDQSGGEVERPRRERIEAFQESVRSLVGAVQAQGARVILLTPSIYDQTADLPSPRIEGVNDALADCAASLRRIADETGAALVDFHGPMARLNARLQADDPAATVVGADRTHPEAPGHLLMAYLFLKAQDVSGIVSRLAIDLTQNVTAVENGVAANIVRDGDTLTFEWTEDALPFPIDASVAPALAWVPLIDELNQEILQVVGLRPGTYQLDIDGEVIGLYDSSSLSAGINLAVEERTPQYRQAVDLLRLVQARSDIERDNLRGLAQVEHQSAPELERPVNLEQMQPYLQERLAEFAENPPAESTRQNVELYSQRKENLDRTMTSMNRLERLSRLAAIPRSHVYRLRRVR